MNNEDKKLKQEIIKARIEERRLPKEIKSALKSGKWILKHRKKKLSSNARERLEQAIARLEVARESGSLKEKKNSLKKISSLLAEELAHLRKSKFREWTESILFALIMVFIIRSFIVQPFKIPTGSMTPTLFGVKKVCPVCGRNYRYDVNTCSVDGAGLEVEHVGDKILVTKFLYGARTPDRIPFTGILLPFLQLPAIRSPQRGDIVVFHFPEKLEMDYVKRLVGLPGETIEIRDGRIMADGKDATTSEMAKVYYENIGNRRESAHYYGEAGVPFTVPKRGMIIPLKEDTSWYWSPLIKMDGHDLNLENGTVIIDGSPMKTYTIEQDYYYVLGDNSRNSRDSRYWGFVPEKYLVGKVFFKYWPPRRWGFTY